MNSRKKTHKQIAEYYENNDFAEDFRAAKVNGSVLVSKGDDLGFVPERKVVTLRLPTSDLTAIREKASRAGIPYQTLIGSVLHRYAIGSIRLKEAV